MVDMELRKSTQQIVSGLVLALFLVALSLLILPVTSAGPDGALTLTGEPSEVADGVGVDADPDEQDKLPGSRLFACRSIHPDRFNHPGGPDTGFRRPLSHQQARAPPRHLS